VLPLNQCMDVADESFLVDLFALLVGCVCCCYVWLGLVVVLCCVAWCCVLVWVFLLLLCCCFVYLCWLCVCVCVGCCVCVAFAFLLPSTCTWTRAHVCTRTRRYSRSRCLKTWTTLCAEGAIPRAKLLPAVLAASDRLLDKSAVVRKSALGFLEVVFEHCPFQVGR
jgi:hypothetical protein